MGKGKGKGKGRPLNAYALDKSARRTLLSMVFGQVLFDPFFHSFIPTHISSQYQQRARAAYL